jgi:hypothetical protein
LPTSASAAGVVHRKLGNPPLGQLALDPRQRRPDQLAMNRAFNTRSVRRLRIAGRGGMFARALSGFEIAQCFR